jgi:hypothetical protein
MATPCVLYNQFKKKLLTLTDSIDFDNGATALKVALLAATYLPSPDTHAFFSDVLSHELTGGVGGYTSGGEAVTGVSVGVNTADDFAYVDASAVTWTTVVFVCRYAVLYKDTGNPATSPLIGYVDFGADQTPNGVNFSVQWSPTVSGGMFSIA